jgi:hypothetical protein
MIGKYRIQIDANVVKYDLTIERKFTILRGNSATGKTFFHSCIADQKTYKVNCPIPINCIVDGTRMWREELLSVSNNIYVIDEFFKDFDAKDFCDILRKSDNYFILITRKKMEELPYSIKSIYQLTENKKYDNLNSKYVTNIITQLYNEVPESVKPDLVITEDSNSGFQFFNEISNGKYACVASGDLEVNQTSHTGGKDKVADAIKRFADKFDCICVIVDGAAFGSSIKSVVSMLKVVNNKNIYVLLPESFEYLLLKSEAIQCDPKYLDETYNYADTDFLRGSFGDIKGYDVPSENINSWEQFYTNLLIALTKNQENEYAKSELNQYYLRFKTSILSVLKELVIDD